MSFTNLIELLFHLKSSPGPSSIRYLGVVFRPLRLTVTLLKTLPVYQCPVKKVCNLELHIALEGRLTRAMGVGAIWILHKYNKV